MVNVVLWVGQHIGQVFDDIFVQTADFATLIVELEHAQIGQQLAFLNIVEHSASDGSVQVEVLDSATVVSNRRDRPSVAGV